VAEGTSKRRLAALLSADVAGYSRLMADDEAATVETLTRYRQVFAEQVERHDGRVVDSPGDNILAEFASPVEAVACANEIQHELARRNRQLAEHRRMEFRIGVNLGDVIAKDDGTIYGDGVNIAARMEALADAGSICISNAVHELVESKLDFRFDFLGEQQVKNIDRPVRVYRMRADGRREPPGNVVEADPVLALPTGPAIAVLAFTNMSGDPEQEYFADGITEQIISELARFRRAPGRKQDQGHDPAPGWRHRLALVGGDLRPRPHCRGYL
jgi:class 3 adenylate cyclase